MSKISPGVISPPREILTSDEWRTRGRALRARVSLDVDQVTRYYDALQPKKAVQRRTSLKAMTKFCDQVDGEYRIRPDHPVIVRFPIERNPEMLNELRSAVALYQETLPADRREVLRRYHFGDFARKVVGVGSVGTEAFVLLLMGDRDDEPLFLQVKKAQESVLAPFAGPSEYEHQAERVARGQRMIQAATDEKGYPALVDAVATGRVQAIMGLVTANPRPRLTGPLLPAEGARRRVVPAARSSGVDGPSTTFYRSRWPIDHTGHGVRHGVALARDTLRYHDEYESQARTSPSSCSIDCHERRSARAL